MFVRESHKIFISPRQCCPFGNIFIVFSIISFYVPGIKQTGHFATKGIPVVLVLLHYDIQVTLWQQTVVSLVIMFMFVFELIYVWSNWSNGVIDVSIVPAYMSYVNRVTTSLQWSEFKRRLILMFVCLLLLSFLMTLSLRHLYLNMYIQRAFSLSFISMV